MNEVEVFSNEQFGKVRTVVKDGEIWFVLKDVCECLGIKNVTDVAERLDDDEKGRFDLGLRNGEFVHITNESGLYNVILRSDKPEAKQFKRWITHEVLPSIRKTGSYNTTKQIPQTFPEALRAYANEVEQRELAEKQRDEAIRTKAWIGSKREATAMNTAAIKSKECEKLKIELDKSKECASIRAVEKLTKKKFDWRKLRNYCTSKELEMKKVSDPLYGKINTYPNEAWKKVYGINLEYLF